MAKNGERAERG